MEKINKKQLSEDDIRSMFITPSIKLKWSDSQIRQNKSYTEGEVIIGNKVIKRGKTKRPDYILYYKPNIPIAIVEAKDNNFSIGAGMQQALDYSKDHHILFSFSSNGDGFIFYDKTIGKEKELKLSEFPSPKELWEKYKKYNEISDEAEKIIESEYYFNLGFHEPRYYQELAINKTIEAIAKEQKRILLVMATGTGKTYVAFQTIWRLKKAGVAKRILYLSDRNFLLDQPKNKDLKPFTKVMTKISKRKADPSYEIYLALYQAVSGEEDWKNIYKKFSKDFFNLIIVDECHRGSAKSDSQWREILEYFSPSIQIGMTATPKETKDASNIDYFGKPIYTYSLRQGIEDGFLAPYKVIKISLDKDIQGYRPQKGELDKYGNLIPDYVYTNREFDRTLVIDERTEVVAKKISEFLKKTDRFAKTIVFCVDIDHAERMRRALVNENSDLYKENNKYIMKITSDDKIGKNQLGNFTNPSEKYPVIVTTSKLLNTGVDAQTCKLIVLDSPIQSMTEFKQIIGRGTRINKEYGKYYFTIMDFRNVTNMFADKDFDGEPVQSINFTQKQEIILPEIDDKKIEKLKEGERIVVSPNISLYEEDEKIKKYYVRETEVNVINETVQYLDPSGKLITESLMDYTKKGIKENYRSLNDFINKWNIVDQKRILIKELEEKGLLLEPLQEQIPNGKSYDPFDLILHVGYGKKPVSRSERARKVKKDSYFNKYGEKARQVINAILDKYNDEGIETIENREVLKVNPLNKFGRPLEIIKLFGGLEGYKKMIKEMEKRLYDG